MVIVPLRRRTPFCLCKGGGVAPSKSRCGPETTDVRKSMEIAMLSSIMNQPYLSGVISGLATIFAAWLVTARLSRSSKILDLTLDFSKRYTEIRNTRYQLGVNKDSYIYKNNLKGAEELYTRFFQLMFDEFWAFDNNFLDRELFAEWMKWRMDDYKGKVHSFRFAEISYKEAWDRWGTIGPLENSRFHEFFLEIHSCENYQEVEEAVRYWRKRKGFGRFMPKWRAGRMPV
jgi:hypothetical protein